MGDMTEAEVDEYISFCARILVENEGIGDHERVGVSGYFGGPGEGSLGRRAEEEQEERERLGGWEEGTGLAAGEEYKIWQSRDVPDELDRVVGRAAQVAGVRAEDIVGVLGTFERRLLSAGERRGTDT